MNYDDIIKRYETNVTIDRLTITFNVDSENEFIADISRYIERTKISMGIYKYAYTIEGGGYLSIKPICKVREIRDSETDEYVTTVIMKDVRYDNNPNKENESIVNIIKFHAKDIVITRIDIAIDFKGLRVSDFEILVPEGLKRNIILGRNGALETLYIGSHKSKKMIRIYDKELEVKKKEGFTIGYPWTRVEVQYRLGEELKDIVLEDDMFGDVILYLKGEMDIQTRALMEYVNNHPEVRGELTRRQKERIKRAMEEGGRDIIRVNDVYKENKAMIEYVLQDNWIKRGNVCLTMKSEYQPEMEEVFMEEVTTQLTLVK